jgi:RimJ/RimL family protein N-acetyltransferase
VEKLRARSKTLEGHRSPDQQELWLNWVLRRKEDGKPDGTLQATVEESEGLVAWVIATRYQRLGYAKEAARRLTLWLMTRLDLAVVKAHVHPQHDASARVAAAAGLKKTSERVDGEDVWRLDRETGTEGPPR